jgi:hypothetical protein
VLREQGNSHCLFVTSSFHSDQPSQRCVSAFSVLHPPSSSGVLLSPTPSSHPQQVYCYHHQYTMKPNYLSSILFGLGISAAVLERAPGKCCFNINAVGSFGNHYWQSPIWQGVEGAFHLGGGGGGNDKKPSDFCYNHQDMSLTDSNGRKCHAQTKTGQLHCLQNPLGRRSPILLFVQNQQTANTK